MPAVTLTRQQLYDRVWITPIDNLARELGLSGRGFASCLTQQTTAEPVELWRVRKGERELRCAAFYLPTGIDVRLLEAAEFRRTQLCRDAPAVKTALAHVPQRAA